MRTKFWALATYMFMIVFSLVVFGTDTRVNALWLVPSFILGQILFGYWVLYLMRREK